MLTFDYIMTKTGKKSRRVGVVAVNPEAGTFGWSFCSRKDKYDTDRGLAIAMGRSRSKAAITLADIRNLAEKPLPNAPRHSGTMIEEALQKLADEFYNLTISGEEVDPQH